MYKLAMFKFFFHFIILSIFLTFSSHSKNYENIIINGNERISSETILVFSEISEKTNIVSTEILSLPLTIIFS